MALSLELIDKIFTSNPNKVVSTYLAFIAYNDYNHNTSDTATSDIAANDACYAININNKRYKISNTSKKNIDDHTYSIEHLQKKDTCIRYYQHSSWLKYFVNFQLPSNKKNTIKKLSKFTNKRRFLNAKTTYGKINSIIKEVANYFNLLEVYYKHQPNREDNSEDSTLELITRFENILDTNDFSHENIDIYKQLEALQTYYNFNVVIPTFVKLVLILHTCGYFPKSNGDSVDFCKPGIHCFLDMILEGDIHKIADFTSSYRYFTADYKFIPLFNVYLGMGYSFVIGWDMDILCNCMIGFTTDGSDGHESAYNERRAISYLRQSSRFTKFEKIDKNQLQLDYIKMLGMRDISILLDYSRRVDVCDMLE